MRTVLSCLPTQPFADDHGEFFVAPESSASVLQGDSSRPLSGLSAACRRIFSLRFFALKNASQTPRSPCFFAVFRDDFLGPAPAARADGGTSGLKKNDATVTSERLAPCITAGIPSSSKQRR